MSRIDTLRTELGGAHHASQSPFALLLAIIAKRSLKDLKVVAK